MADGMPASASLEVVKRVRSAETEWDERLTRAKADRAARLATLTTEAETSVASARAAADADRTRTVEAARSAADREAAQILTQGKTAAQAAASDPKGGAAARRADILSAVLAELAGG